MRETVFIFKCNNQTQNVCLNNNLFAAKGSWVNDVKEGNVCLLYNYQSEVFYGIWKATKDKGNLDPKAFGGQYPNQVRVQPILVNGFGYASKSIIEELTGEVFTSSKPFMAQMPLKVLEKLFENSNAAQLPNTTVPVKPSVSASSQDKKHKLNSSKRAWLGVVIGLLGSVATMVLGIWLASERREPVFAIEPRRAQIVTAKYVENAAINVTRRDGSPVRSDVSVLTFYFWNQGSKAIRQQGDVFQPVKVGTDDPSVNILEMKVVGESRKDVTQFSTMPDERNANGQIKSHTITFNVLDEDDGMTGQIIFEGDPYASFGITGSIEGVKSFGNVDQFLLKRLGLHAFIMAIIITIAGFLESVLSRKPVKGIDLRTLDKPTIKKYFLLTGLFIATLLACAVVVFYMAEASNSKVLEYVPPAIAPRNL